MQKITAAGTGLIIAGHDVTCAWKEGDEMAKDDYHVIVYQILAYLYQRLKKGESVDESMLSHNGALFKINKSYWAYIIYNMHEMQLISGVAFVNMDGETVSPFFCLLKKHPIIQDALSF